MASIKTKLFEYQKQTVQQILHKESTIDGGLLLSSPGTGKTLCMLAAIVENPLPTLIICPSGLVDNWIVEINKHTSGVNATKYYGAKRKLIDNQLIYVTSYMTLISDSKLDQSKSILTYYNFGRIILDEGHMIRNSRSKKTLELLKYNAKFENIKRWVLSATIIYNDSQDLYPIFLFLENDTLTKSEWNACRSDINFLKDKLGMYSIKYDKKILNLPEKIQHDVCLKFSDEEFEFYESLLQYSRERIIKIVRDTTKKLKSINHHNIFLYILRLKQACNSPYLLLQSMKRLVNVSNLQDASVLLKHAKIQEDCPICYDVLGDVVAKPCGHACCELCWEKLFNITEKIECPMCRQHIHSLERLNSVQSAPETKCLLKSSKIEKTIELVRDITRRGEKVIIVSQWLEMLNLVKEELKDYLYVELNGKVPMNRRMNLIEQYESNPNIPICYISMMANSEGINLCSANHLILLDNWWNMSKIIQISDRIHRIGQTRETHIYKLTIENTIEKKINKMLYNKHRMSEIIIDNITVEEAELTSLYEPIQFKE